MQQLLNVRTMLPIINYFIMVRNLFLCVSKTTPFKLKQPSFYLAHLKIPLVENCKYLGITISTKNSDLDLRRQMRKIYANANLLLRKFSCCSVSVKCYLFKTYCSTLYCASMWFDFTKTAFKKIESRI